MIKHIQDIINEELELDNMFWLLDKWFERNNDDKGVFVTIISNMKGNQISKEELTKMIDRTSLQKSLKEFISFIENDMNLAESTDYIYKLKKLIEAVKSNKSKENKYTSPDA